MTEKVGKRVCIITAGHVSTCPRMLKAADLLADAGYSVRVVSAKYIPWASVTDSEVRNKRGRLWDWAEVDYDYGTFKGSSLRIWSGLRFRCAKMMVKWLGITKSPLKIIASAYNRVYPELLTAALAGQTDLFYGGTGGGLAVAAEAARRVGVPYALDLEDFHTAEQAGNPLEHFLAERIEREVLPGAVFLTAGSEAISVAYLAKYGICPIPLNNTFPLPAEPPNSVLNTEDGLKLYWFSQTIGPGRGLEDIILAMGIAKLPGELHLRGRAIPEYMETLQALINESSPRLKLFHHEIAPPDEMVQLCQPYDVGLALEQPHVFNRALCLTNKAFTYMLAGLPVIFTDTPGQRPLAVDIGEGALLYKPGDVRFLSIGLKHWAENKKALLQAKKAAWNAARRRWHWEHSLESGALLKAVKGVFEQ